MNLNTITELKRPSSADEVTAWKDGYAWLAGGTWLFSEPQVHTDTLIDLAGLKWQSLAVASDGGLEVAATCTIHDLYEFKPPKTWKAGALIGECCRSFLSSFKIWHEASIGGTRSGRAAANRATSTLLTLSPAITKTFLQKASCCAAFICRRPPSANDSHSGARRLRTLDAQACC